MVNGLMTGLPLAAISVVDLAIWDLIGKIRKEPIYKMIGGRTKKDIPLYLTGPKPEVAQKLGFWGGKVPLPHGPSDGHVGLKQNVEFLKAHREKVGPDFPIMVDCYMSLDVVSPPSLCRNHPIALRYSMTLPSRYKSSQSQTLYYSLILVVPLGTSAYYQPYTIELVKAVEDAGVKIYWWEECLHPDDFDGHLKLNQALPHIKFTTGEHEYSK